MFFKRADYSNYSPIQRGKASIKFLVIHYTANNGDTARGNLEYYSRPSERPASAHYYVDENEVCCSVPWNYTAWHCGGGLQGSGGHSFYQVCKNSNSIGIELCSRKDAAGNYYFKQETVDRAAAFTAELMKTYSVKIDKVIRHFDVTGKLCPRPFIDEKAWGKFKNLVLDYYNGGTGECEETMKYYEKIDEIPAGEFRDTVQKMMDAGIVKGASSGLHLSEDMVRLMVYSNRAGGYPKISPAK